MARHVARLTHQEAVHLPVRILIAILFTIEFTQMMAIYAIFNSIFNRNI